MIGRAERVASYVVLIVFAAVVFVPIALLLLTALSPQPNGQIVLTDLRWQNFADAWQRSDFGSHLILSLVLAGTVTLVTVLIAPLAAYSIAVLKIPGHRALFALFLVGIMIPLEGIIVPLYFTMRATPFASTIGSLIIAQVGLSVGFGVFWMRAAFLAIPPSLLESASLDGAGRFRLYRSIVLPLATPATITLALLTCMWVWNDYFLAFVLVNNPDQLPVTVALGDFTNKYATQINLMSACAVLVALPIVILYLFFQRRFIAGVLSGALKG
jgi:raffinose/stachyose/melibiose transport system permease protein